MYWYRRMYRGKLKIGVSCPLSDLPLPISTYEKATNHNTNLTFIFHFNIHQRSILHRYGSAMAKTYGSLLLLTRTTFRNNSRKAESTNAQCIRDGHKWDINLLKRLFDSKSTLSHSWPQHQHRPNIDNPKTGQTREKEQYLRHRKVCLWHPTLLV